MSPSEAAGLYGDLDTFRQEIRVLQLLPSAEITAPISCHLAVISLRDIPLQKYITLSYAWGDSTQTKAITVDGVSCQVTTNLEAALRNIRDIQAEMVIWADAICINQNSLKERSHQVTFMNHIFSKAERSITWLGEESDDSNLALLLIEQWTQWANPRWILPFPSMDGADVRTVSTYVPLAYADSAFSALINLGRRAYWSRLWCLQELILPQEVEVMCGRYRIRLKRLGAVLKAWEYAIPRRVNLRRKMYEVDEGFVDLLCTPMVRMLTVVGVHSESCLKYATKREHDAQIDSFRVMSSSRHLRATDPRDKIFGVLNLLAPSIRQFINVDYEAPEEAAYWGIGKALLSHEKNLMILDQSAREDDNTDSMVLPSWLPRWTMTNESCFLRDSLVTRSMIIAQDHFEFDPGYRYIHTSSDIDLLEEYRLADLWTEMSERTAVLQSFFFRYPTSMGVPFDQVARVDDGTGTLLLRGCHIDTVVEMYRDIYPDMTEAGRKTLFEKFVCGRDARGVPLLQALFGALALDRPKIIVKGAPMDPDLELDIFRSVQFLRYLARSSINLDSSLSEQNLTELVVFLAKAFFSPHIPDSEVVAVLSEVMNDERFMIGNQADILLTSGLVPFRTANGMIGVGQRSVCPGDVIVRLAASPLPSIFHAVEGHYIVRGECFIHGVDVSIPRQREIDAMAELEVR